MKRIKLRAWHIAEKKMCKVETLTDKGAFLVGVKKGEDQSLYPLSRTIVRAPEHGRFCDNDEFELMQFTGLLDKRGKEIYEGDLLNVKTTFQNNMADKRFQPHTLRQVGFDRGVFIDVNSGVQLYDKIYSPVSHKIEYEIIGNVFESPDLL